MVDGRNLSILGVRVRKRTFVRERIDRSRVIYLYGNKLCDPHIADIIHGKYVCVCVCVCAVVSQLYIISYDHYF